MEGIILLEGKVAKIGVFDSGVGGLSVLREIIRQMPELSIDYFADQAHVPYGPRPLQEVRGFAEEITRFLLSEGAQLIVIACNAASATALHHLRATYPTIPFVGMEPAVKPAAEYTHSGVVGVLATPATFQGELYASVIERFANEVKILQDTCPGLVRQIETGKLDTPETEAILRKSLEPMIAEGIDTVVLGCTHYPFVIPLIQKITGPKVRVIDPAPAIARQVQRLLDTHQIEIKTEESPVLRFFTTGNIIELDGFLQTTLGIRVKSHPLNWTLDNRLIR